MTKLTKIVASIAVFALLFVAGAEAAPQNFDQLLQGDYAFSGDAACVSAPAGFTANFMPLGPTFVQSFSVQGIRTFNGDGTGSVVGRTISIGHPGSGSTNEFSADFMYTVTPDRTLLVDQGPTTSVQVLGPSVGSTRIYTGNKFAGYLGQDMKTIVVSTSHSLVEVGTATPGGPIIDQRICHRSRTLIKR